MVGTQMSAINNKIYEVLSWSSALANKGCSGVANGFNIISIIVVIIEGAKLVSSKSVIHFIMIKTSIYPNVQSKNKNYGMNSNTKSKVFDEWIALNPLSIIPKVIWITPIITANFIL